MPDPSSDVLSRYREATELRGKIITATLSSAVGYGPHYLFVIDGVRLVDSYHDEFGEVRPARVQIYVYSRILGGSPDHDGDWVSPIWITFDSFLLGLREVQP